MPEPERLRLRGVDAETYLTGLEMRIDADRAASLAAFENLTRQLEVMNATNQQGFELIGKELMPLVESQGRELAEHRKRLNEVERARFVLADELAALKSRLAQVEKGHKPRRKR
jgi:hypothetical protein